MAPVADLALAVFDGALLGQAGGGAIADVLFGLVSPSARLTETVPMRIQDTPAYLDFPGEHSHVAYGEGLFVGYRWYDAREIPVTFPFGHGLSLHLVRLRRPPTRRRRPGHYRACHRHSTPANVPDAKSSSSTSPSRTR
ncbi:glycoside hydrolase family 3 C-terminal domain-containing protein [Streptomyces sp. KL116D]|uniref:glycoside hydrolase family 3 C-terminal domain-containing protein n=1 Tax=Streptomyces sp. KL116D TaxID=3045152 RepID=UPI00355601D7